MNYFPRTFILLIILATPLLSCSSKQSTPEKNIRLMLEKAEQLVETRKRRDFMKIISEDFKDKKGNNKQAIENILRFYLLRNKSIHVFTSIKSIDLQGKDYAKVELIAALTGQAVESERQLVELKAEVVHFGLELISPDEGETWLIWKAEWDKSLGL